MDVNQKKKKTGVDVFMSIHLNGTPRLVGEKLKGADVVVVDVKT